MFILQEGNARMPFLACADWSWQPHGLDFAGLCMAEMFWVMVGAYSKYLDAIPMSHASSTSSIDAFCADFFNRNTS